MSVRALSDALVLLLAPCLSYMLYRSSYKGTTLATRIRRRRPAARSTCDCLCRSRNSEDISIPLSDRNASCSIVSESACTYMFICTKNNLYLHADTPRRREKEDSPSLYGLITVRLSARASITTRHRSTTRILSSIRQRKIQILVAVTWDREQFICASMINRR